jgi:hypothetical protein
VLRLAPPQYQCFEMLAGAPNIVIE